MSFFEVVILCGQVLLIANVLSITLMNTWYFIYNKKNMSRTMVLLMFLLIGTLFIELMSEYLSNRLIPNLHLSHYYTIGLFFILSVIYYNKLKKFQLVVPIGVILFSSVLIYQLLTATIIYNKFNTTGFLVAACVLMSYAFFYYIEHITKKKYWDTFNVGLFLYLGGSSVIFFTMNNWKDLGEAYMYIWTINAALIILYQGFISVTIYRFHRHQKNQNGISSV